MLKFKYSIIWVIIIFILSSISGDSVDKVKLINIPHFDKFVHFSMYFILSALMIWESKFSRKFIIISILLGISYGIIIELLQQYVFVKRYFDIFDIISNSIGTISGLIIFILKSKLKD